MHLNASLCGARLKQQITELKYILKHSALKMFKVHQMRLAYIYPDTHGMV